MNYSKKEWWERFKKYYTEFPSIGLAIDLSRMEIDDEFIKKMEARAQKAFADMKALESGAIANPDENRMVGHYWLRDSALAPTKEIKDEIDETIENIKRFALKIHNGEIRGERGGFTNFLLIGIGGSALGPQFVANALGDSRTDKLRPFFFDNTDPDGMDRVLGNIGIGLSSTLCIVISKSGGTKETRNGMLIAKEAYEKAGLNFSKYTIAITMEGSELDKLAIRENWLARFPMWDWVGGRTSELSAVGLLPAALQGFDIDAILAGARDCDNQTRIAGVMYNPAMLLALAWFASGNGKGQKNMVVLPYKDRLELLSKYLQQLIMESLGKELDVDGRIVNQGITVLGNKGATDQHSYIQQLREGLNDFFVVFIEVLKDGNNSQISVGTSVTSGDYLDGFYLGTRQALTEKNRQSITIVINQVSPRSIGTLISLFERSVGFYSYLINVNAYNQPGVEAGKMAANNVIIIQSKIFNFLLNNPNQGYSIDEIASQISSEDEELIFKICEHLSANCRLKKTGFLSLNLKYGAP